MVLKVLWYLLVTYLAALLCILSRRCLSYSIQHYEKKFVSDLWQVGGFLRALGFPPPIKLNKLIPLQRPSRNCNTLAFSIPSCRTSIRKESFYPRTTKDWNALKDASVGAPIFEASHTALEYSKDGLTSD
jgi:hypothetical protein